MFLQLGLANWHRRWTKRFLFLSALSQKTSVKWIKTSRFEEQNSVVLLHNSQRGYTRMFQKKQVPLLPKTVKFVCFFRKLASLACSTIIQRLYVLTLCVENTVRGQPCPKRVRLHIATEMYTAKTISILVEMSGWSGRSFEVIHSQKGFFRSFQDGMLTV